MLYPKENAYRQMKSLDGFWNFCADKENVGLAQGWGNGLGGSDVRIMGVPASWNEQHNDLYNFHGKGWYEKDIFVPAEYADQAVYIRCGSVAGEATIYVNGHLAARHIGTALPFEVKINDFVTFGASNKLVILADSTLDPWSLPPALIDESEGRVGFFHCYPNVTYDFFPYGGIQRSVWLYTTPKTRIEDIAITTAVEYSATVTAKVTLSAAVCGAIRVETAGKTAEIPVNGTTAELSVTVENPRLWDIGQPELYDLTATLLVDNTPVDSYTETYGIRTVKVEGNQFLLNGKPVFFKGFGKHEDFSVLGKGFNHALTVKDFYLLGWVGANSFRTSHYPYDENILDMADRAGILVIDETPFVGLNNRMFRPDILEKAKSVIGELFNRDKNHPSVVMWSLANEPYVSTPEAKRFFEEMAATARALDSTRPITYVAHMEPEDNLAYPAYDVVCINKYYGWYIAPGQLEDSIPDFADCLQRFYDAFGKPIIVSEFGADCIEGIHSDPAVMFSEEYQSNTVEQQYLEMRKKDFVIGAHVWAFADFKTAQSKSRIVLNRKGVFTRDRQPKMVAHTLKRLWKE